MSLKPLLLSAAMMAFSVNALAAVSGADAARLGADLTPMGAEKAGNAAGTIPAWTGGITTPIAGFKAGGHYPDPFPSEKAKFEITAANMAKYAANLTPGQQALLKKYPDWKMEVYETHRTAGYPKSSLKSACPDTTTLRPWQNRL